MSFVTSCSPLSFESAVSSLDLFGVTQIDTGLCTFPGPTAVSALQSTDLVGGNVSLIDIAK